MTPAKYRKLRSSRRGITPQARVIYRAAFNGETMPRGWSVSFVGRCRRGNRAGGYLGVCRYRTREIEVLWPALHSEWLNTLIHEFIHLRCRGLRHGAEFERLVDAAVARVWE